MSLSSGTLGRAVLKRDPLFWLGLEVGDGILELQRQAGAEGKLRSREGDRWPLW